MLPGYLLKQIKNDDGKFAKSDSALGPPIAPRYNSKTHYLELTRSGYYNALIIFRHHIKKISDYYFGTLQGAKNIDLFMLTPSISSPMGPGSDSEALPIKFGKYDSNLVDSSQFGFEPLLLNGFEKVYCYLPSMRGEKPDKRHLNQFFHCEAEIVGGIEELLPIIEGYVKTLAETTLSMPNIIKRLSIDYKNTKRALIRIIKFKKFPQITFDQAVTALQESDNEHLLNSTQYGRDITQHGETVLARLFKFDVPFWIRDYDRDRVAFYQKPNPKKSDKVINADLIFPSIIKDAFGGEIVGCGQRQDNPSEILISLKRQNINPKPYKWYIDLRKLPKYKTTSGFGLGIERFITWSLCRDDIKEAIPYPRLKDIKTCP